MISIMIHGNQSAMRQAFIETLNKFDKFPYEPPCWKRMIWKAQWDVIEAGERRKQGMA
jgi:hypothetical protein